MCGSTVGPPAAPTRTASGFAVISFATCPTTDVSVRTKRSLATIRIPAFWACAVISAYQLSP